MRIYKADGTYTEKGQDEFGWYLTEAVNKVEPRIKIQMVESFIDPLQPEGLVPDDEAEIKNVDAKCPERSQVSNLINPCSVESKILLSVVHFAKYKTLVKDVVNLGDLHNSGKLKFLMGNKNGGLEEELREEVNQHHETEERNVLSLMMELILKDCNSSVDELTDMHPLESSDLGNSIITSLNSGDEEEVSLKSEGNQRSDRSEMLSSLGIGDVTDRSNDKICEESYDIHLKIAEIKRCFEEDEARVNSLIEEAKVLHRNLRETRYLDSILHLLRGDLDKIVISNAPFRIFHPTSTTEEPNLII